MIENDKVIREREGGNVYSFLQHCTEEEKLIFCQKNYFYLKVKM